MANPVNGRVHLTASVKTGSAAAWNTTRTAIEKAIKEALEGIEIKGVVIDGARLDFVQTTDIIGGEEPSEEGEADSEEETDTPAEEEGTDDAEGAEGAEEAPKEKKSKKDKGEKSAKAGKKKGRK